MTDIFENLALTLIMDREIIVTDEQFSPFTKYLNNEGMKSFKDYVVTKVESGWLFKIPTKLSK